MAVEEQFRDTKGCRYGVEVVWNLFEQAERVGRFFVCVGIALAVWTAMGHEIAQQDPTARLPHPTKGPRRSLATIGRQAVRGLADPLHITVSWFRGTLHGRSSGQWASDCASSDQPARPRPGVTHEREARSDFAPLDHPLTPVHTCTWEVDRG